MSSMSLCGFEPTHPGEVLKDEIECRGISQKELAEKIGMPYKVLNEILNGHRNLSVESALLFEASLDVPANVLLNLQMKYNMQMAKNDKSFLSRLESIRKLTACFL